MEEKKYLGNEIKSIFEIVKLGSTAKIDKGTLVEMTAESVRNMNDQLLIQLPLKFQILENDEPKADVDCTLTVNNLETTGMGTTNDEGIVEWDNHKEVSEMMILPMACNLSYEDKSVNINVTEESDEGSVIQIENGRLKGDDNMIYSLDEQVVGTWIDGRNVYQKVFKNEGSYNPNIPSLGVINPGNTGVENSINSLITNFNLRMIIDIKVIANIDYGTSTTFSSNNYYNSDNDKNSAFSYYASTSNKNNPGALVKNSPTLKTSDTSAKSEQFVIIQYIKNE